MLTLSKLTLKNACQHSDLVVMPGSGLVAILGANGSGKSNVLRLIVYALTSYVDGTWGSQSDLQMDTAATPGYVEVHLRDSEHTYRIRRYFLDAVKYPDEYQVDSGQLVCRRAKVNAKLTDLFGIQLPLLATIIWAKQEMFDWLLCAPSAAVKAFFADVFNAEILDTARSKLASAISSIYVPPDRSGDIKNMTDEIASLEASIQQTADQLKDLETQIPTLEETCSAFEKASDACMSYNVWISEVRRLSSLLSTLNNQEDVESCDITEMQRSLSILQRRCANLQQRQTKMRAALTTLTTEAGDAYCSYSVLKQEHASIENDLDAADCGECPLCHTDLGSPEIIHKLISDKYGVPDIIAYQTELVRNMDARHKELVRLTARRDRLSGLCTTVQSRLQVAMRDSQALSVRIGTKEHDNEHARVLESQRNSTRTQLKHVYDSPHVTEEATIQYQNAKTTLEELRAKIHDLNIKQASDGTLKAAREEAMQTMQTEQQAHDNAMLLRTVLVDIRECFGPKRAQATYIAHRMESLNDMLDTRMKHTNLPFELFFDCTDCLFKYRTADGFVHPTGHLSGAQKKICAMLLQVCLYEHVQPNLDLLLLDEVDAALDPANRVMLAEMLALLRRDSSGCIIVATREQETIDQCNHVIDITHREE